MDQDRLLEDVKRTAEYFRAEAAELRRRVAALERELAEARRDRARLRWYFDPANAGKVIFLELRCINSGRSWTCDEWIAAIDAAMGGE